MSIAISTLMLLMGQSPAEAGTASPLSSTAAATLPASFVVPASPRDWHIAVQAAMRRSSPTAGGDVADAVPELIWLYEELRSTHLLTVMERERLRSILRYRLELIAEKLAKRTAATKSLATQSGLPKVASIHAPEGQQQVLAQFGGPGGRNPGGAGGGARGGGAGGGARPGQARDYGPDLVDLIKTTIAPDTWDDRGGPGTIYYYRPLQVLVIRQTGEVHHSVGGALRGLRGR